MVVGLECSSLLKFFPYGNTMASLGLGCQPCLLLGGTGYSTVGRALGLDRAGSTPGSAPHMLVTEESISLVLNFLICEMGLNTPTSPSYEV